MMEKKKLLLIDTFNFLHRAYHALPKTFSDKDGNPTNAIYGVTSMLINMLEIIKPDYIIAATESKDEDVLRKQDFDGYKAHRKPLDEALAAQIEPAFGILDAFGVKRLMVNGYEADDIIGTLTKRFASPELEVIISSNDRDLWQLLDTNTLIMLPNTQGNFEWLGINEAQARLEFTVDRLIDYKALKGDTSDNIPGVPGIGEKTAKNLLQVYKSLEDLYENIESIEPKSLREKLIVGRDSAFMSKKLATIITDLPIELNLNDCKYTIYNKVEVKRVLEKYNFKSLIKRLGFETEDSKPKASKPADNQLALF